jgi:hypothetical protein
MIDYDGRKIPNRLLDSTDPGHLSRIEDHSEVGLLTELTSPPRTCRHDPVLIFDQKSEWVREGRRIDYPCF